MNYQLRDIIKQSNNIVFFGGAGVSTESGIPDFRGSEGLYKAKREFGLAPEQILTNSFFRRDPETFFKYYKDNMIYLDAKPNKAHLALAKLEEMGKLSCVITQNIDGLHQKAGSKHVYQLHGAVEENYCTNCGMEYDLAYILDEKNCENYVPMCANCGKGIIRPRVTLYEEALDEKIAEGALDAVRKAEILIVGGTSLSVYPAAGFITHFQGEKIILINKDKIKNIDFVDIQINQPIGQVLGGILDI